MYVLYFFDKLIKIADYFVSYARIKTCKMFFSTFDFLIFSFSSLVFLV